MSLTTDGSISKYERLIAGTPYWRERKLVTSSSLRRLSFTNALPRLQLFSFCTFIACCNCSGVMIFSFTRRSPSLCDMPQSPVCTAVNQHRAFGLAVGNLPNSGSEVTQFRRDTNCHLD